LFFKKDILYFYKGTAMKNNPLLPAERQQRILEILREEFTIRSSNLSELLCVSEMTIRRDLDALDQRGLVERTHGGAFFRQERVAGKFQYNSSIKENLAEKKQIARMAATMIEPHDTIYIGEGTTTALIPRNMDPALPCLIFTNNLGIIAETNSIAAEIVVLGGTYDATTNSLAGPLTMEMIRQVNAKKVFLGADGLSLSAGMTTPNLQIAIIDRSMIQHTRGKVFVLSNHTKFGLVAEMSIAPLKQIDVLITNRKIPQDFQNNLNQLGVEVIIA
jgi:DeoR/GlpR family transcriptional regulator of sugar metabolism